VNLFENEKVTFSAGVPTVWVGIQQYLMENPEHDTSSIRAFLVGGSAVPRAMIEWFHENRGITVVQGWGMTETSPLCVLSHPPREPGPGGETPWRAKSGRPVAGMQARVVDDKGAELPHDGATVGELQLSGPWVTGSYYKSESTDAFTPDGWLRTGDVGHIDEKYYVQLTDRTKDVIKSGGEWISSIDLENAAVAHPEVAEAAAIGVAHPKWDERPVLVVVKAAGGNPAKESILALCAEKFAKWQVPDDVVFVDEIPHTATGKISKLTLRQQLADMGYRHPEG